MIPVLLQSFKHVLRSRLLVAIFILTFVVQFMGLRLVHTITIQYNGVMGTVMSSQGLFLSILLQLFAGAFVASVYGIWMMPYLHQGPRAPLTFVVPVSKWLYPATYALTLFVLLVIQHLILLFAYGTVFGFASIFSSELKWSGLLACMVFQTIAFEAMAFVFAGLSLRIGAIFTFFIGAGMCFALQISGILVQLNLVRLFFGEGLGAALEKVYQLLPPVGNLVSDLKGLFATPNLLRPTLGVWALYLTLFVVLFRYLIRSPALTKSAAE